MRSKAWIPWAARRYIVSRRRNKTAPSSLLSIVGIATGVLALIVVLSVMNGFQMGFIESILEISSYHVRVEEPDSTGVNAELVSRLSSVKGVTAVLPFVELETLMRGYRRDQHGALVRGIPADAAARDPSLASKLVFESGAFDLSKPRSILLGAELAVSLGVEVGDEVSLMSLSGSTLDSLTPEDSRFTVTGLFRSGFYEYDLGWAFIDIASAAVLQGTAADYIYGVKLKDRFKDSEALSSINRLPGLHDAKISSWRDYNRSFFGALRTEKLLMFILVALIFIVVALNIFQAQRRSVLERREEIGLLRAVGASSFEVRLIFACDGFLIGASGSLLGLVPALLITKNIGTFFTLLERAANACIGAVNSILSLFHAGTGAESFSVFSPAVFYIKEIPSRVVPHEVILIVSFGLLSATIAAWMASSQAARVRPAEVLRYE